MRSEVGGRRLESERRTDCARGPPHVGVYVGRGASRHRIIGGWRGSLPPPTPTSHPLSCLPRSAVRPTLARDPPPDGPMELTEYREYLRRADAAERVRDLHQIANEALLAHPGDPDAEAVERVCFDHAEAI